MDKLEMLFETRLQRQKTDANAVNLDKIRQLVCFKAQVAQSLEIDFV
jgi:hypothetical protein